MDIDSVGTNAMITALQGPGCRPPHQEDGSGPPWMQGMDTMDISAAGRMQNTLGSLSEEDRAEMKDFHQSMVEAVENGTFDASEMAAQAPEALKTLAEEKGLDLEQMLEDRAAAIEEFGGHPPPPPPMAYGADGSGISGASGSMTSEILDTWLADEDEEDTLADLLTQI